jgi:hypothetical protein
MGHPENWSEGLRDGAYHNPGTQKRKDRGKHPRVGKLRFGIRKKRMARRREK